MVYIKVVVLNTIYNFVVENVLKSFRVPNMCFNFIDLKFRISKKP
jgi:hypothetical protein